MVAGPLAWENRSIAEPIAPLPPPTPPPPPQRPDAARSDVKGHQLTRTRDGRVVGGVASGIAKRFGIDPLIVRIAFVVLTVVSGSGVLLYMIGWLWLPNEDTGESIVH